MTEEDTIMIRSIVETIQTFLRSREESNSRRIMSRILANANKIAQKRKGPANYVEMNNRFIKAIFGGEGSWAGLTIRTNNGLGDGGIVVGREGESSIYFNLNL